MNRFTLGFERFGEGLRARTAAFLTGMADRIITRSLTPEERVVREAHRVVEAAMRAEVVNPTPHIDPAEFFAVPDDLPPAYAVLGPDGWEEGPWVRHAPMVAYGAPENVVPDGGVIR